MSPAGGTSLLLPWQQACGYLKKMWWQLSGSAKLGSPPTGVVDSQNETRSQPLNVEITLQIYSWLIQEHVWEIHRPQYENNNNNNNNTFASQGSQQKATMNICTNVIRIILLQFVYKVHSHKNVSTIFLSLICQKKTGPLSSPTKGRTEREVIWSDSWSDKVLETKYNFEHHFFESFIAGKANWQSFPFIEASKPESRVTQFFETNTKMLVLQRSQ